MADIRNAHLFSIDRRTTLRWLAAATAAGQLAACGEKFSGLAWPEPPPITGKGYGTDPDLYAPKAPWPLTLTKQELATTAALADLILPAEGDAPSASQVGVEAFVDEWVSAPYPSQQEQRKLIIPGLAWLDQEALTRGQQRFDKASPEVRKAIADDIAFKDKVKPGLEKPAEFFARMRALTLGAYYTTPEGWKQIGYPGNNPFVGPYPGPTVQAIEHIKGVLDGMGLKFAFPETGKL
jgi:gluconate 2-dehydrogenase subunit 3-like protein